MILCAGESLIDMLPRNEGSVPMLQPVPGGAVMNTAIALGRLDVPVTFVSGVGRDQFGRLILDHLEDSNVNTAATIASARPTTLAFVDVTDGVVSYDFYDENTAGRMIEPTQLPDVADDVSAVFFGGISLINEPAADSYATMQAQVAERCVVMMDPNIRPALIKNEDAFRARLTGMLAKTDIVKTSDEDLAWLFPEVDSIEAGIQALMDMGPQIVLFTEGSKGATAYRKAGDPVFVTSESVTVVDTVGAGDTFNGGFLAALSDADLLNKAGIPDLTDAQLATALKFAGKCAAISVTRAGAQPPRRNEL